MKHILATCKKHGVGVGHPHVTSSNVERVLAEGYRLILSAPVRSYGAAQKALEIGAKPSATSDILP
jgi:4-hydroxy-2-oxoheptanedioate aldolase